MFETKYMKSQPKAAKRPVRKFKDGGMVDQINRKGPQYDLDYEIDVRRSQLRQDDPSYNKGQGPTPQNLRNLEYTQKLETRRNSRKAAND